MKRHLLYVLLIVTGLPLVTTAYGQGVIVDREREKRGQSGLQFLDVTVSPRAAAMANAISALELTSSEAMFHNPATMAYLEGGSVSLGTFEWIADISYNAASIAYGPSGGRFGVIGFSILTVDYGELEQTIIDQDPAGAGYIKTGTFSPTALAVGVGYAKSLTDRFSVGGNVRYARQDLGQSQMSLEGGMQDNAVSTPTFDFGVLYRTGFESLNLAVTARNFSPAVTYEEESFEAPLSLNIAVSMDVLDVLAPATANQSFLLAVEAGHPRSYAEQIRIGGEYRLMDVLSLRAGYIYPTDEQGINLGAGIHTGIGGVRLGADYAYSHFGDFGNVNRIGINFGF